MTLSKWFDNFRTRAGVPAIVGFVLTAAGLLMGAEWWALRSTLGAKVVVGVIAIGIAWCLGRFIIDAVKSARDA